MSRLLGVSWQSLGIAVAWRQGSHACNAPVPGQLLLTRGQAPQSSALGANEGNGQRLSGCQKVPRKTREIPSHRHPPKVSVNRRPPEPVLPMKAGKNRQLCLVFAVHYMRGICA